MTRIRTKIAVTGLNYAEIAEGLTSFRQYLRERPWLINPRAGWDAEEGHLTITIEAEGDDRNARLEATFGEVSDGVMAAFTSSAGEVSLDILEVRVVT